MAAAPSALSTPPMLQEIHDVDKLTNEIFSILENKILSIDAGGSTDGILAAKTLLHFQSILRRKSGNPTAHIADFFDVVTGAGAGGILAGLLFTRGKDGGPMFTADESLKFIVDNCRKLTHYSPSGVFRRTSKAEKVLNKVFGDLTLKDTLKAVLIPCYDLRTGAPFLFSRADALELDGCDFKMAEYLKSTDGTRKILAVGGGLGMSNPTAAAITHVLNNKQEFPLCKGVEDLLVVSLGNGELDSGVANHVMSSPPALVKIAADGAADMVDQAVSMAFGQWRTTNYRNMLSIVDEMLGQKNVESILFQGKKLVEFTNMEKLEMFGGELIKEQERRKNCILPTVVLKHSTNNIYSPRSSSATTLSTLSSY
ncbi:hypothetical protein Pfo_028138 [Paulownia fortunei]|nr:hypothetical protein Pfo_028138 [Paulownia fortunei]